jgi:hypothetical protein
VAEFENDILISLFTEEKAKETVFSMGANRSLGPDGFSIFLYQFYWDTIRSGLLSMFLFYFYLGHFDISQLNKVVICLTSKLSEATKISSFGLLVF